MNIEDLIDQKKYKMAKIAAYYASNILINNKNISDNERLSVLMGLKEQIDKIN